MKGKVLRKHSLHGEKAASVLVKLFISGNKKCYTTEATSRMRGTLFFPNVNNIQSIIPENQKNNYTMM